MEAEFLLTSEPKAGSDVEMNATNASVEMLQDDATTTPPSGRLARPIGLASMALGVVVIVAYGFMWQKSPSTEDTENLGALADFASAKSDDSKASPLIYDLLTTGAPGAISQNKHAAWNFLRQKAGGSRCFPGLRIFRVEKCKFGKCVDAVAGMSNYAHACTSSLSLNPKATDSRYYLCKGEDKKDGNPTWPVAGTGTPSINMHWNYSNVLGSEIDTLAAIPGNPSKALLHKAWVTALISDVTDFANVFKGWKAKIVGNGLTNYRMVGLAQLTDWLGDKDVIILTQNSDDLSCILTFAGTNSGTELMSSDALGVATNFCGMKAKRRLFGMGKAYQGAHKGFVDELRFRLKSKQYRNEIQPKLSTCARVTVAGHSLGGALAELFSWCAEGGNGYAEGSKDYKMIRWSKGTAALMEAVPASA